MNAEEQYLNNLRLILENGVLKENRTGINAITFPHTTIQHDMNKGFPLITTKKMGIKNISTELEFFIKGLRDKQWLKDRNCHIWDEWCNPSKIPNNLNDEERKSFQRDENDLGLIYGNQWRNFNSSSIDQLKEIVDKIKNNPNDRRMVCSAWNPIQFNEMALPPCHVLWQVTIVNNKLHLCWYQRSCDYFLGIPYNIASYGLLLKLLALEGGYEEGILTGFLADSHIYENHIEQVNIQLKRKPFNLPNLVINNFKNIFDWEYTDVNLIDYSSHEKLTGVVAV